MAFLLLSLFGAALTLNALFPRSRRSVFAVPSFFAAWPTTELAPQFVVVQLAGTVAFVRAGALDETAGLVALGIAIVSWAGLVAIARTAGRTGAVVEHALAEGLGADYAATLGDVDAVTAKRSLSITRLALALPLPETRVEVVRNVRYADGAGRRHLLDVYRPANAVTGAPVLLQIHGGAWIIGNKREQALPLMHHLAATRVGLRRAELPAQPARDVPDHLVDVKLALRWIREHVAEYGGDPGFVAITGGSAGRPPRRRSPRSPPTIPRTSRGSKTSTPRWLRASPSTAPTTSPAASAAAAPTGWAA